jgi:hypothetical protein
MTAQPSAHVFQQDLVVDFSYPVHFSRDVFAVGNPALSQSLEASVGAPKLLVFVESEIVSLFPDMPGRIAAYSQAHGIDLVDVLSELAGGEAIKQDLRSIEAVWRAIYRHHIDRHSYVMAIGGGAFLDAVGFAAATAFRGVRLIRVPTTVLAQADSAVGVKNAINYLGRKNGIGTFMPPAAVINDFNLLDKLPDRDWIAGTIEAVKVALIRDEAFFAELERLAPALVERDPAAMERLVIRSEPGWTSSSSPRATRPRPRCTNGPDIRSQQLLPPAIWNPSPKPAANATHAQLLSLLAIMTMPRIMNWTLVAGPKRTWDARRPNKLPQPSGASSRFHHSPVMSRGRTGMIWRR